MVNSLDDSQYTEASIRHYEAIFGRDFVSPGGGDMARQLIARMRLPADSLVLDVGCGIGGAAFLMAQEFDLRVEGVDLSVNMIRRANKRARELDLGDRVSLQQKDCLTLDVVSRYDAIYSRDVFLHIHDKTRLFRVLRRALAPGGTLLFTDYCCGEPPWSGGFSDYVASRGYCLHTISEYAEILKLAGFQRIAALDWTDRFIRLLGAELKRIPALGFTAEESEALSASWQQKIGRSQSGEHRWGMFYASI